MKERFIRPLASSIGDPYAEVRAALFVAVLAGVAVIRDVLGVSSLSQDLNRTARWMAPLLDLLVEEFGACGLSVLALCQAPRTQEIEPFV